MDAESGALDPGGETPNPDVRVSTGVSTGRRVAIGCFTAWLGLCSGAMVAALVSKMVAYLTRAPGCAGIPSCNWYIYALIGGGIGAVSLPLLVLWTLGKPAKGSNPHRGL